MTPLQVSFSGPVHEDIVIDSIRIACRSGRPFGASWPHPKETTSADGRLHILTDVDGATVRWTDSERPAVFTAMGKANERRRARGEATDQGLLVFTVFMEAWCEELHVARDSSGPFTNHYLVRALDEGRVVAMRDAQPHGLPRSRHASLYIGTPNSTVQVRVYDRTKVLEKKRGMKTAGQVTRFEIVTRRQMAAFLAGKLARTPEVTDKETGEVAWPVLPLFNALLSEQFYVLQSKDDPHRGDRARAKLDPLYQEFITIRETNIAFPLLRERPDDADFEDKVKWVLTAAGGVHMIRDLLGVQGMEAYMARGASNPLQHPLLGSDPDRATEILMRLLGIKPAGEKGGTDV